jgi:hypothetical protein
VLGVVARRLLAETVALVFAVCEPSGEDRLASLPELEISSRKGLRDALPARNDAVGAA